MRREARGSFRHLGGRLRRDRWRRSLASPVQAGSRAKPSGGGTGGKRRLDPGLTEGMRIADSAEVPIKEWVSGPRAGNVGVVCRAITSTISKVTDNYGASHPYRLIFSFHWLNATIARTFFANGSRARKSGYLRASRPGAGPTAGTVLVAPQGHQTNGWSDSGEVAHQGRTRHSRSQAKR